MKIALQTVQIQTLISKVGCFCRLVRVAVNLTSFLERDSPTRVSHHYLNLVIEVSNPRLRFCQQFVSLRPLGIPNSFCLHLPFCLRLLFARPCLSEFFRVPKCNVGNIVYFLLLTVVTQPSSVRWRRFYGRAVHVQHECGLPTRPGEGPCYQSGKGKEIRQFMQNELHL